MKRLRKAYGCPVELAVEFVGGKWKTVILAWLKESPLRYNELRTRIPGVADKVLTERLKDLEQLGLVEKGTDAGRRGGHIYRLTDRGERLRPALDALYAFGSAIAGELPVTLGPRIAAPKGAAAAEAAPTAAKAEVSRKVTPARRLRAG
ncbi:helix-turn-helix domain-containing protein [Xanthobacter sp. KR7-65]|uniref:winged helix-turn-helix transcriptional regulator n=1 Tax=Xanthobacter sp. KR7-65 TaxID=3156612 RepID=UPI0032B359AF